jgi:uncharacterized membrane protein
MSSTILAAIKLWHVHPVADHFTIALLIVGVLFDLAGSVFWNYRWIRYAALTLMILGAAAAGASWVSGGWEAHKVWQATTGEAKTILSRHAELGDTLAWVFAALALWRLLIESLGFVAGSRPIYLIVAIIAVCVLGYQGYIGGEMVYDYGVGTALYSNSPTPSPQPTTAATPTPIPTVYVPTAAPTPSATPTASESSSPAPTAASSASPTATSEAAH